MASDNERHPLPTGTLANLDQLEAELTELVGLAREHMAGECGLSNPCCPGHEVMLLALQDGPVHAFDLLLVAIVREAREVPRGDDPRD